MKISFILLIVIMLNPLICNAGETCPSYAYPDENGKSTSLFSPDLIPFKVNIAFGSNASNFKAYLFGNNFSTQSLTNTTNRGEYYLNKSTVIFIEFCNDNKQVAIFKEKVKEKTVIECHVSQKITCVKNKTEKIEPIPE